MSTISSTKSNLKMLNVFVSCIAQAVLYSLSNLIRNVVRGDNGVLCPSYALKALRNFTQLEISRGYMKYRTPSS